MENAVEMIPLNYKTDSTVEVHPFNYRTERDTVTLEIIERHSYLSIPHEGLDVLLWLSEGKTVEETVSNYEKKYEETPDIEDFLDVLAAEGLVGPGNGSSGTDTPVDADRPAAHSKQVAANGRVQASGHDNDHTHQHERWHLSGLSPDTARHLFGRWALTAYGIVIATGLVIAVTNFSLVPRSTVFLFPENFALLTWTTVAVALVGLVIHELAHVVTARAAGSKARIQIGNRMYVPVAETDMTGVWMAPKWQRHLAFMSGPIIDAVFAGVFLVVLLANERGWFTMSSSTRMVTSAVLFTFITRITWQLLFFFRTDLYYVFATGFNCKNLMDDTEDYLRNAAVRVFKSQRDQVDQSGIPQSEMRAVRAFAPVWLIGRAATIGAFMLITIPVLWGYLSESTLYLTGRPTTFGLVDFLTAAFLVVSVNVLGIVLWVRSLRSRFESTSPAPAAG